MLLSRAFRAPSSAPGFNVISRGLGVDRLFKLNELKNIPGSKKKRKRVGRGIGSAHGKTCGHGHQFSRSTPFGFEGGQTPMYRRMPKIGFKNINHRELIPVNLDRIQEYIDMGRLQPKSDFFLTMRDIVQSGMVIRIADGIKLLANGKEKFRTPVHFEVTAASEEAIKTVEAAGGTVTCTHFNTLALRALLKPYKFDLLPQRARPNPHLMQYYLDKAKSGYLSPEVQMRNLKLFGTLTSEDALREEHAAFLAVRRVHWKQAKQMQIAQYKGIWEPRKNRRAKNDAADVEVVDEQGLDDTVSKALEQGQ